MAWRMAFYDDLHMFLLDFYIFLDVFIFSCVSLGAPSIINASLVIFVISHQFWRGFSAENDLIWFNSCGIGNEVSHVKDFAWSY